MKRILNILFKRLSSKSPTFFRVLQVIAGVLVTLFFSVDAIWDLCSLVPALCNWQELIYTLLLSIIGIGQLAVSSKSKNIDKIG